MDYVAKFKADTTNFNKQVENAKRGVTGFSDETKKQVKSMSASFNNIGSSFTKMVGAITATGLAMKGFSLATDAVKNAINSTQTTQDAFNMKVEQMKGGLNEFYRTLATGDWSHFMGNMKAAIELSKKFFEAMDNLDTSKVRFSMQISAIDVGIAKLRSELAKYAKSSEEYGKITGQIEDLMAKKAEQNQNIILRYNDALNVMVQKELLNTQSDIEQLVKVVDETNKEAQAALKKSSEEIKELQRRANQSVYRGGGGNVSSGKKRDRDEAAAELKRRRASQDVIVSSADRILEQPTDFKEVADLFIERNKILIDQYGEAETINKKIRSGEEARLSAMEKQTAELRNQAAEIQKILDEYNVDVKVESPKDAKFDTTGLTPPKSGKMEIDTLKNPYLSNDDMSNYDAMIQRQNQLNEAIKIATALYGEQSAKVQELKGHIDEIKPPTDKFKSFAEGLETASTALDMISNSSDKVKDNPAIKALAFSLLVLNSAQQIAKTSSWVETIIAAAALATSTISFVASLKSQKFAGGGVVSPAASGDQMSIRVNPGEMILNQNQQRRLFSLIGKEQPDSIPAQIELVARGHNLVGVINNYNRKYTR